MVNDYTPGQVYRDTYQNRTGRFVIITGEPRPDSKARNKTNVPIVKTDGILLSSSFWLGTNFDHSLVLLSHSELMDAIVSGELKLSEPVVKEMKRFGLL